MIRKLLANHEVRYAITRERVSLREEFVNVNGGPIYRSDVVGPDRNGGVSVMLPKHIDCLVEPDEELGVNVVFSHVPEP